MTAYSSSDGAVKGWRAKARRLKNEIAALYLAYKDPRVPWYAKVFACFVVAYALSPIDLIPDFIPVLGYLDDLIFLPVGIGLALKMIPSDVLDECRRKAASMASEGKGVGRAAAVVIVVFWIGMVLVVSIYLISTL